MAPLETYKPEQKSRIGLWITIAVIAVLAVVLIVVFTSGGDDASTTQGSSSSGGATTPQPTETDTLLANDIIPEDDEVDLGELI